MCPAVKKSNFHLFLAANLFGREYIRPCHAAALSILVISADRGTSTSLYNSVSMSSSCCLPEKVLPFQVARQIESGSMCRLLYLSICSDDSPVGEVVRQVPTLTSTSVLLLELLHICAILSLFCPLFSCKVRLFEIV